MEELASIQIECIFNEAILLCVNSNGIRVFRELTSASVAYTAPLETS